MEKRILSIACKILGIYCIILAINWSHVIFMFSDFSDVKMQEVIGSVFPFTMMVVAAFCLIKKADWIATRIAGGASQTEVGITCGVDALKEVVFSTVGLFVLIQSIPRIAQAVTYLLYAREVKEKISPSTWVLTISYFLLLIICIYLILGSRGFVGILRRLKESRKKTMVNWGDIEK